MICHFLEGDSDNTETTVGGDTDTTVTSVESGRGRRVKKRKRNDDSLQEELEKKTTKVKPTKSNKKVPTKQVSFTSHCFVESYLSVETISISSFVAINPCFF